jgi:hypothetical protein
VKTLSISTLLILLFSGFASAQWTGQVLWNFEGAPVDGAYSVAGLVSDKAGNLYGTTMGGGVSASTCYGIGCGTVFELSPGTNGTWTETVLHNFCPNYPTCPDGSNPHGGLVLDAQGNLYGTTAYGGNSNGGGGVVYELSPSGAGSWTYQTIYTFCAGSNNECQDGANPRYVTLTLDERGDLYGTTSAGGTGGYNGVVFELSPGSSGWTETVLYNFCSAGQGSVCPDGSFPQAGVTFDKSGNLYGTTSFGGSYFKNGVGGNGVVYKLTPGPAGWTETVLYDFPPSGIKGSYPEASVSFDARGNLYSTFLSLDSTNPTGVFQITTAGKFNELFLSEGLEDPEGGLLVDSVNRVMYGSATAGDAGSLFQIVPPAQLTPICTVGGVPEGNLIQDVPGNIYGTTVNGGLYRQGEYGSNGVVYECSPPSGR